MNSVDLIEIGEIIKEHGVKGEVKVAIYSGSTEHLQKGQSFIIEQQATGEHKKTVVESVRPTTGGFLVCFALFRSPEAAKPFRRARLLISKAALKRPQADDHYIDELYGFEFFDSKNNIIGIFKKLFGLEAALQFMVVSPSGQEILIPVVSEWIRKIDREKRAVYWDIPEGLVEVQMGE